MPLLPVAFIVMHNGLMVAYLHSGQNLALCRIIVLLAILAGMLGGCATHTPPFSSAEKPRRVPDSSEFSYRGSAAYNRPYKVNGITYFPMRNADGYRARGIASWYGSRSGRRTATGSRFRPQGLTAAHKTLPLPCRVKVTNLRNDRSVVVLVNDRGPFVRNRLIDLSHGAAKALGIRGLAEVEVEYLDSSAANEE